MPWVFQDIKAWQRKILFYTIHNLSLDLAAQYSKKKKWGDIYLDNGQILSILDLNNLTEYTKPQKHKTVNLNER